METSNRMVSKVKIHDTTGKQFELTSITVFRNGKQVKVKMTLCSRIRMWFYSRKVSKLKQKGVFVEVYMDRKRIM